MAERGGPATSQRPIALIGFMGAGKTTFGRDLNHDAVDSDREIERRHGPIREIFAGQGEAAFRRLEEEVVLELLGQTGQPESGVAPVVSLGGGAVLSEKVREALGECTVVWLDIDVETAWRRAGAGEGDRPLARDRDRPLARDRDRFEALYVERREIYRDLADATIPSAAIAGSDVERRAELVARIQAALSNLALLPAGTKLRWASSRSGSYPIYIGSELVESDTGFRLTPEDVAGAVGSLTPTWPLPGRPFQITDTNVAALIDARRQARSGAMDEGELSNRFALPPGEEAKTLANVGAAIEAMAEAGFTRADHVVAIGGGVVGDLGGFSAAVYQRGVPVIQVPTTVVAQVDSAYGGKTGVDLPGAKNYVGAYHQPSAVITDTSFLLTLPAEELAAGFVEVLKTALLAGGRLWEAVRELEAGSAEALASHPFVIADCAGFKCEVVAADERDGGLRQILNLGHTVGHAIETATAYRTYRHGEAVGLGLLAALRLSGADALRDEVESILAAWGLPVRIDRGHPEAAALGTETIVELTRRDKKRLRGETPFVLLAEPGAPEYGRSVSGEALTAAVEELFGAGGAA